MEVTERLSMIPQYFDEIIENFSEELLKLLNSLVKCKEIAESAQYTRHLPICILLGKVVKQRPDLQE